MTVPQSKTLVFIGRFQPLHDGHVNVIREALDQAKDVIILVGSAYTSRSPKNPFTYEERKRMIETVFSSETKYEGRLHIRPLLDTKDNTRWIANVGGQVDDVLLSNPNIDAENISLFGFKKDASSKYLEWFPHWGFVSATNHVGLFDATSIREMYFQRASLISDYVPQAVKEFLTGFRITEHFAPLVHYAEHIREYKYLWRNSPFPPIFVTVDAVCIHAGHVLLVERGQEPGRGLLALPGGFLKGDKTVLQSVIEELKEETRIADKFGEIPPGKLESFIDKTKSRVFDEVDRSLRGRTITHAFYFAFPDSGPAPIVHGGDDAAEAGWYPLSSLTPDLFYDDHFQVLEALGLVNA